MGGGTGFPSCFQGDPPALGNRSPDQAPSIELHPSIMDLFQEQQRVGMPPGQGLHTAIHRIGERLQELSWKMSQGSGLSGSSLATDPSMSYLLLARTC